MEKVLKKRQFIIDLLWSIYYFLILLIATIKRKKIKKIFFQSSLNENQLNNFKNFFSDGKITFKANPAQDIDDDIIFDPRVYNEMKEKFNNNYKFLNINNDMKKIIHEFLDFNKKKFQILFGLNVKVLNIRAWKTKYDAKKIAANEWHSDNFKNGIYKIMIYLNSPSYENGTTEIKIKDKVIPVLGPEGTWMIFDNTNILHRGISPKNGSKDRLIIEITARPSFSKLNQNYSSFKNVSNGLYPYAPY